MKVPLVIGCCACWVDVLEPEPMSLLPEPLPMVTPPDPLPVVVLLAPALGVVVLGFIVLLPVLLVPVLVLPLVCAWAVEKASAVPAVRRATVRKRENIV